MDMVIYGLLNTYFVLGTGLMEVKKFLSGCS